MLKLEMLRFKLRCMQLTGESTRTSLLSGYTLMVNELF
jgi:hypothetical protein